MERPFISFGSGFRRALLAVLETRGTPCTMRGSFMKEGSSFAGATESEHKTGNQVHVEMNSPRLMTSE